MSEPAGTPPERITTQHMMRRLDGFARGLGLDEAVTCEIVEQVVADMPGQDASERLLEARTRLILAAVQRHE